MEHYRTSESPGSEAIVSTEQEVAADSVAAASEEEEYHEANPNMINCNSLLLCVWMWNE